MRKYYKRGISVCLAASLTCLSLTGCTDEMGGTLSVSSNLGDMSVSIESAGANWNELMTSMTDLANAWSAAGAVSGDSAALSENETPAAAALSGDEADNAQTAALSGDEADNAQTAALSGDEADNAQTAALSGDEAESAGTAASGDEADNEETLASADTEVSDNETQAGADSEVSNNETAPASADAEVSDNETALASTDADISDSDSAQADAVSEDAAKAQGEIRVDDVDLSDDSSDFVLVSEAVPDAILEIRYYSTYNFVGDRIDGYEEPLAFLTKEAAAALKDVSDDLKEKGYRLKIFDAYRPQKAVTHFFNWALDTSDTRMKKYFYPDLDKDVLFPQGYIAAHSGHSRGSTVDLTLFDMNTEKEVDMGGTFDHFGIESHPDYKDITDEQYENRMILRDAMLSHGFKPLDTEWWHFTLENEPYPETYFTFPINSNSLAMTGNKTTRSASEIKGSESRTETEGNWKLVNNGKRR